MPFHEKNRRQALKLEAEEAEHIKIGETCGINVAAAAYTSYFFSESYESFEYHITDIYNSGGAVGTKNHSKNFPSNFLKPMYESVKSKFLNFIIGSNVPFGYLADKMTVKHRARHMVGMRIPIFDLKYDGIVRDVFIQSSPVKDLDGKGISQHITDSFLGFGLPLSFQRKQASGMAMDGQYTKLNVEKHVSEILDVDINLSWDPAHRVEKLYSDSEDIFVTNVTSAIHSIMKNVSHGKNYETLLEFKDLSDTFLEPKIFKSMKFISHSLKIFETFDSDFKSLVATLEHVEDSDLRDKVLKLNFILDYLFLFDICKHLTKCSKWVQVTKNLPWNYPHSINNLNSNLISMKDNLKECQVQLFNETFQPLNTILFPKFSEFPKIISKREYKGIPPPDVPVSSIQTRSISKYLTRGSKSNSNATDNDIDPIYTMMNDRFNVYIDYISKLKESLDKRFSC